MIKCRFCLNSMQSSGRYEIMGERNAINRATTLLSRSSRALLLISSKSHLLLVFCCSLLTSSPRNINAELFLKLQPVLEYPENCAKSVYLRIVFKGVSLTRVQGKFEDTLVCLNWFILSVYFSKIN